VTKRSDSHSCTFVLVHGGWCWRRVADQLRMRGHQVFTPTLTGLGERSHLLSPNIDLTTHVTDVLKLIEWEGITDFVLCGHSYGGMVVTGVAQSISERIRSIVYLDAFVPTSGRSVLDYCEPERRKAIFSEKDGIVRPVSAHDFRVNEADQAWVDGRCSPHPAATFHEAIPDVSGLLNLTRFCGQP